MTNQRLLRTAAKIREQGRWTEQLGREVVEVWRASGLSGIAAARSLGVDPQRLYWWRDRLGVSWARDEAREVCEPPSQFVPVVVCGEPANHCAEARIVVELGAGLRVHVREANAATAGWVALLAASLHEVGA